LPCEHNGEDERVWWGPEKISADEQARDNGLLLGHRGRNWRGSSAAVRPDKCEYLPYNVKGETGLPTSNHTTRLSHSNIQRDREQTCDQLHPEHRSKSQESRRKTNCDPFHRKCSPRTVQKGGKPGRWSCRTQNG